MAFPGDGFDLPQVEEKLKMREPIRVFIVDPNPLARKVLTEVLSGRPELRVLGAASTPSIAARRCSDLTPEVLLLDLERPIETGLRALNSLREGAPVPAVLYTSLDAFEIGEAERHPALAISRILFKPEIGIASGIAQDAEALSTAIISLATLDKLHKESVRRVETKPRPPHVQTSKGPLEINVDPTLWIIAIGASTGGTQAVSQILNDLPPNSPGIVVVQHMPSDFTGPFAKRLDEHTHFKVREAVGGEPILPGTVLIAHGGKHMEIAGAPGNLHVNLSDGPKIRGHRPSVDVLFRSVARTAGPQAVGVLLTGMGDDGAAGLLEMKLAGARTLAQDEQTSTVFGMPRAAYESRATDELVPLSNIAERIVSSLD